jgi:hypothetical protein
VGRGAAGVEVDDAEARATVTTIKRQAAGRRRMAEEAVAPRVDAVEAELRQG